MGKVAFGWWLPQCKGDRNFLGKTSKESQPRKSLLMNEKMRISLVAEVVAKVLSVNRC